SSSDLSISSFPPTQPSKPHPAIRGELEHPNRKASDDLHPKTLQSKIPFATKIGISDQALRPFTVDQVVLLLVSEPKRPNVLKGSTKCPVSLLLSPLFPVVRKINPCYVFSLKMRF